MKRKDEKTVFSQFSSPVFPLEGGGGGRAAFSRERRMNAIPGLGVVRGGLGKEQISSGFVMPFTSSIRSLVKCLESKACGKSEGRVP